MMGNTLAVPATGRPFDEIKNKMKKSPFLQQVFIPGIAGTTAMSAYSYVVSLLKNKNYKEPVLLGKMATRLIGLRENKHQQWIGWLLHYVVGLLFAELYTPFWNMNAPTKNIKTGLVLGGISGLAAILIWKFTLSAHPLPPAVHFTGFAMVLFAAHLVFGLFTAIGYNIANKTALCQERGQA